jgi:hypothetical protein
MIVEPAGHPRDPSLDATVPALVDLIGTPKNALKSTPSRPTSSAPGLDSYL